MTAPATVFDRISALADPTRSRMLRLLEHHELTVSELCAVLQLPQSTTSRHLKTLADEAWVVSRAEGTSRRYRMARLEPGARRLWSVVREQLAGMPAVRHDEQRVQRALAARRETSREFFSTRAGQWDRVRAELFGGSDAAALLALLADEWTIGDLGCGTGRVAGLLAPFVRRVIAVDESAAMLAAARKRLAGRENVELRRGDLEALPIDEGALDAAVLFLVLHYVVDPPRVLAEAARALAPGGRLLVVDMQPHDRQELHDRMGHVWPGFAESQLRDWLGAAGFDRIRLHPLPPDPEAKGPTLFVGAGCRVPGVGGR